MAMQWERVESGYWELHDKPGDTARQRLARRPVAWITGLARAGYHGSIGAGCDAQFHGRTIPQVKRQIEDALTR